MAYYHCGSGGKTEFLWEVYGLSGHINTKNRGSLTLEVVDYQVGGTIGIYGTNDETDIAHGFLVQLGSFTVASGAKATIDTGSTYDRIVLYPLYSSSWSEALRNKVKVTVG